METAFSWAGRSERAMGGVGGRIRERNDSPGKRERESGQLQQQTRRGEQRIEYKTVNGNTDDRIE